MIPSNLDLFSNQDPNFETIYYLRLRNMSSVLERSTRKTLRSEHTRNKLGESSNVVNLFQITS